MNKKDLDKFLEDLMNEDLQRENDKQFKALMNIPKTVEKTDTGGLVWPDGHNPNFTEEQKNKIAEFVGTQTDRGIESMAMKCKKHECPFKNNCIIYQMDPDAVPEGKSCPIELTYIHSTYTRMSEHLGITDADFVDKHSLKDYVMYDVFTKRMCEELAEEGLMTVETTVGVDPATGRFLTRKEAHPAFRVIQANSKVKQLLLNSLLATREAKTRANIADTQTFSGFLKELMVKVEEKKKAAQVIDTTTHKLIDVEKVE